MKRFPSKFELLSKPLLYPMPTTKQRAEASHKLDQQWNKGTNITAATPRPAGDEIQCQICGDSGFVRVDSNERWNVPLSQQMRPCRGEAHRVIREERLKRLCGMTDVELSIRLSDVRPIDTGKMVKLSWQEEMVPERNTDAIELARDIIANPFNIGMVCMWGPNGNGKTMIAHAIVNEISLKGGSIIYMTLPDLIAFIKASYEKNDILGYSARYDAIAKTKCIIVDEFDLSENKTRDTDHNIEFLQRWVNERYRLAISNQAFTLLVGNMPIQELGLNAVNSRLNDGRFGTVINAAPDYRPNIKKEKK